MEYIEINVIELSVCLAENDFKAITKDVPEEDVYEYVYALESNPSGIMRQMRPYWVSQFNMMKQSYLELILKFSKEPPEVVVIGPEECTRCGARLQKQYEKEQGKCYGCQMDEAN